MRNSLIKNFIRRSLLVLAMVVLASEAQSGQLQLTWTDNSTNEDGFKIERKTGTTGTYAEIATVGADVTSYTNSALVDGTAYCFQVRAYNAAGNSAFAPEACGTVAATVQNFTLTVAKSGTGIGTVTATGKSIAVRIALRFLAVVANSPLQPAPAPYSPVGVAAVVAAPLRLVPLT